MPEEAALKGDAVVGRDHYQRVVPHALPLEPAPQVLQLEVGEAGLQVVALERHVELPLVAVDQVRQAGDQFGRLVAVMAPVRQVLPGDVRQERLLQGELRSAPRIDPRDPVLEADLPPPGQVSQGRPGALATRRCGGLLVVVRAAEVAPGLGYRGQVGLDVGRRDDVQPDETEVVGHRPQPVRVAFVAALVPAQVAGADGGVLIGDVEPVGLGE
jgi:hypothetical protein